MRASDPIFFASGAAALVYQVVWARLLGRALGSDASGTALILALFMGGMALGAELGARAAARSRAPERGYAFLLFGVAVWAACTPWLLDAVGPVAGLGARAVLAGALLLPPTVAMGATFPFMGRLAIRSGATAGGDTAAFYGANTLGAAAGALSAAFLLLPSLGFTKTLFAAAALDALAGAAAWMWLGRARAAPSPRTAPVESAASTHLVGVPPALLAAPFLLGASSLALEVVLTRVLISVTGASVYAFALVLAIFLAGLGLGARQGAAWLASRSPREVLAACAWGATFGALFGALLLAWRLGERDLFATLSNRMPSGVGTWRLWVTHAVLAALALLPCAFAFGLALPAAIAAAIASGDAADTSRRERILARLYALNTAGATLGALVAGFVLLPRLGPRLAFAVALAPGLVAALALAVPRPALRMGLALAVAALGAVVLVPRTAPGGERRVLAAFSGPVSNAAVEEVGGGADTVRALRVDGKVVATTAPVDRRLQVILGALPAWLADEPESALVIGLGTGMTAGALLPFETIERVEVVELSVAVARAARHFAPWNRDLLDSPRVDLVLADGRHHLLLGEAGGYDVVTADPIHPWTRGSADLYALEHFRAMSRALSPRGVASQWLPLYQLSQDDVRTVVATWCAAFDHTAAWLTAYDLALVGAHRPLDVDPARAIPTGLAAELAALGVPSAAEWIALAVADDAALRAFAAGVQPMVEDDPVLEFRAPKSFLAGYSTGALRWAGRPEFVDELPEASRPAAREVRALLDRFLAELPDGLSAAAKRYGDALVARTAPR